MIASVVKEGTFEVKDDGTFCFKREISLMGKRRKNKKPDFPYGGHPREAHKNSTIN